MRGDFFAIDRRTSARVCELGVNAAVAYLVLARSTGRNNRETRASVHAIETYTGISRGRARRAIDQLIEAELVIKGGSRTKPVYQLLSFVEILGDRRIREVEEKVLERVFTGQSLRKNELKAVPALLRSGWLVSEKSGYAPNLNLEEPQWIWLPNAVVTGASDETPPVERLRQTQDSKLIRLFADLYWSHQLDEDGGIGREYLWTAYERRKVAERGAYTVWGFVGGQSSVSQGAPWIVPDFEVPPSDPRAEAREFWTRFRVLLDLGLVAEIPMLMDGDGPEAEVIHPCGGDGTDALNLSAWVAAESIVPEEWQAKAEAFENACLFPVIHHRANVTMRSVFRLRYRPSTRATGRWFEAEREQIRKFTAEYDRVTEENRG